MASTTLTVEGQYKGQGAFAQAERSIGSLEQRANKAGKSFNLFNQVLGGVGKFLTGPLGITLSAGAAASGLTLMGAAAFRTAKNIDVVAERTGFSATAIKAFGREASLVGEDLGTVEGLLETFSDRVLEAVEGSGEGAAVFRALGIEIRDAGGKLKPTANILNDYIKRVNGLSDQTYAAALNSRLLGTDGVRLIPVLDNVADSFLNVSQRTEEQVEAGRRVDENWGRLLGTINNIVRDGFLTLAPALEGITERLLEMALNLARDVEPYLIRFGDWLEDAGPKILTVASNIGSGLIPVLQSLASLYRTSVNPALSLFNDLLGGTPTSGIETVNNTKDAIFAFTEFIITATAQWEQFILAIQQVGSVIDPRNYFDPTRGRRAGIVFETERSEIQRRYEERIDRLIQTLGASEARQVQAEVDRLNQPPTPATPDNSASEELLRQIVDNTDPKNVRDPRESIRPEPIVEVSNSLYENLNAYSQAIADLFPAFEDAADEFWDRRLGAGFPDNLSQEARDYFGFDYDLTRENAEFILKAYQDALALLEETGDVKAANNLLTDLEIARSQDALDALIAIGAQRVTNNQLTEGSIALIRRVQQNLETFDTHIGPINYAEDIVNLGKLEGKIIQIAQDRKTEAQALHELRIDYIDKEAEIQAKIDENRRQIVRDFQGDLADSLYRLFRGGFGGPAPGSPAEAVLSEEFKRLQVERDSLLSYADSLSSQIGGGFADPNRRVDTEEERREYVEAEKERLDYALTLGGYRHDALIKQLTERHELEGTLSDEEFQEEIQHLEDLRSEALKTYGERSAALGIYLRDEEAGLKAFAAQQVREELAAEARANEQRERQADLDQKAEDELQRIRDKNLAEFEAKHNSFLARLKREVDGLWKSVWDNVFERIAGNAANSLLTAVGLLPKNMDKDFRGLADGLPAVFEGFFAWFREQFQKAAQAFKDAVSGIRIGGGGGGGLPDLLNTSNPFSFGDATNFLGLNFGTPEINKLLRDGRFQLGFRPDFNFSPFADGGVVTEPQIGLVGEAGPEAIIPLKNGSVPVDISGDASRPLTDEEIIYLLRRQVVLQTLELANLQQIRTNSGGSGGSGSSDRLQQGETRPGITQGNPLSESKSFNQAVIAATNTVLKPLEYVPVVGTFVKGLRQEAQNNLLDIAAEAGEITVEAAENMKTELNGTAEAVRMAGSFLGPFSLVTEITARAIENQGVAADGTKEALDLAGAATGVFKDVIRSTVPGVVLAEKAIGFFKNSTENTDQSVGNFQVTTDYAKDSLESFNSDTIGTSTNVKSFGEISVGASSDLGGFADASISAGKDLGGFGTVTVGASADVAKLSAASLSAATAMESAAKRANAARFESGGGSSRRGGSRGTGGSLNSNRPSRDKPSGGSKSSGGYGGDTGGFFANGGIVLKTPGGQLSVIGEGRYNEAIVPLPNGKSIPVAFQGNVPQSKGNTFNITVNVAGGGGGSDYVKASELGREIVSVLETQVNQPGGALYGRI